MTLLTRQPERVLIDTQEYGSIPSHLYFELKKAGVTSQDYRNLRAIQQEALGYIDYAGLYDHIIKHTHEDGFYLRPSIVNFDQVEAPFLLPDTEEIVVSLNKVNSDFLEDGPVYLSAYLSYLREGYTWVSRLGDTALELSSRDRVDVGKLSQVTEQIVKLTEAIAHAEAELMRVGK